MLILLPTPGCLFQPKLRNLNTVPVNSETLLITYVYMGPGEILKEFSYIEAPRGNPSNQGLFYQWTFPLLHEI